MKEVAYLLGFIWADGYVSNKCIDFCINKEDFDNIKNIIEKTGKWTHYKRIRKDRKKSCGIKNSNKILLQFLHSVDYKEKSFRNQDKILKFIPNELKHYFWRGYFDGDGCIYLGKNNITQVSIGSTKEQDWSSVVKILEDNGVKFSIKQRIHKSKSGKISHSSSVIISSKDSSLKFLNYIYKDFDGIGLIRKYEKYLKILNN